MKCPNCGKIVPDKMNICDGCGYTLRTRIQTHAKSKKRRKKKKVLQIIPISIICMAVIIVVLSKPTDIDKSIDVNKRTMDKIGNDGIASVINNIIEEPKIDEEFATTWDFDESTGTLTIGGHGYMKDYSGPDSNIYIGDTHLYYTEWLPYVSQIQNVVIEKGVTKIGRSSFEGCENLRNVSIPDSVQIIGSNAFKNCVNLDEITLPYSVNSIGVETFEYCSSLKAIQIPEGVTYIPSRAFQFCENLTEISLPDSLERIGTAAFGWCSSLDNIQIPDNVNSIDYQAFEYSSWLSIQRENDPLVVVNGILITGDGASGDIIIPKGVHTISQGAFAYNNGIESVTIPEGITEIRSEAFFGCSNLKILKLPEQKLTIYNNAFACCEELSEISFPTEFIIEDDRAISLIERNDFNIVSGTKWLLNQMQENPLVVVGGVLIDGTTAEGEVTIPEGVKIIASSAFIENENITMLNIPDSVTKIGKRAFQKCSNLSSINIPCGVSVIPEYAFTGCYSLNSIELPNGIEKISSHAFGGTALETIVFPETLREIESEAFYFCEKINNIIIPKSVETIGTRAFRQCPRLENVIISNKENIMIGSDAFLGCPCPLGTCGINGDTIIWEYDENMQALIITGSGVMDDYYYSYNGDTDNRPPWDDYKSEIQNISISGGITHIGSHFADNTAIFELSLPDGIESIGVRAFAYCENLSSVKIPDSVAKIGTGAFEFCSNLSDVKFPNNPNLMVDDFAFGNTLVKNVPHPAKGYCGHDDEHYIGAENIQWKYDSLTKTLHISGKGEMEEFYHGNKDWNYSPWYEFGDEIEHIKIDNGLTAIGEYTFERTACKDIYIPESVTRIGGSAFRDCDSLTDIYYSGSRDEWNEIEKIEYNNDILFSAKTHYNR